jgi:hypothetical protein
VDTSPVSVPVSAKGGLHDPRHVCYDSNMDYAAHRRHYRENHKTVGCKIMHMLGVPLIAGSLIVVFFQPAIAVGMFVAGWALPFSGHFFFEKNRPVLLGNPCNWHTYWYGLVFASQEWWKLLTRRRLTDDSEDK